MKNNNKKSNLLIARSVTLLIIIIGLFLVWDLSAKNLKNQEASNVLCKNKVKLYSSTIIKILNTKNSIIEDLFSDIISSCSPKIITIKDEQKQNEKIQKEIEDCWWKFGEGSLKFLRTKDVEVDSSFLCMPCSKIILKDDFSYNNFYFNYLEGGGDIDNIKTTK